MKNYSDYEKDHNYFQLNYTRKMPEKKLHPSAFKDDTESYFLREESGMIFLQGCYARHAL